MSNFNIDSGSTDNIYEPQPSDSPSGPHGIAETDDAIITDLEASESGVIDLAGRLAASDWSSNHNYEKLQLAISPAGAFNSGVQSLVQSNSKHTSGTSFDTANWTHIADLFDATPTFNSVNVTGTVNAGGGFIPANTGNIHGDGQSLYLDGGGSSILLRPGGVGVDAGSLIGESTGKWATYDASGNIRNTLDDGAGNVSIAGHTTLGDYIIASASYLHLRPAPSGFVGFTNNGGNMWGLYVSDAATPSAYTVQNTLDDGSGNLVVKGNIEANNGIALGTGNTSPTAAGIQSTNSGDTIIAASSTGGFVYLRTGGVNNGARQAYLDNSGIFWVTGNALALGSSVVTGSVATITWKGDGSGYPLRLSSTDNSNTGHGGVDIYDDGQLITLSSTGATRNVLDDGAGNVSAAGYISVGSTSSVYPALHLTAVSSNVSGWAGNIGFGADTNEAVVINTATGKGLYTAVNGVKSNILDDGAGNVEITGHLALNTVNASINGTTAGTATWTQPYTGSSYKKVMVYLAGYENNTTTAQTITFSTAFTNVPYLAHDDSGGSTVTATTLTLAASMNSTKTGWIVVEGF